MSTACRLQTLFSSQQMSIAYCARCDLFHVDTGALTLRLTESEFRQWSEGFSFAQARYTSMSLPARAHVTLM
jgi:hypothetical protein